MFSLLKKICFNEKKNHQANIEIPLSQVIDASDGLKCYPVCVLLDKYSSLIEELKETSGLDYQTFQNYVFPLIESYGKYVHLLPASERHHHRYGGGLFVHGLEVAIYAGKLSRNIIFDHENTQNRSELDLKWRCGSIVAGLLHDLGKPISDLVIRSDNGNFEWCPFVESLTSWFEINHIERYFVYFQADRYRNHELLGLSALDLVLTREIRSFLSPGSSRSILSAIYSYLGGHNLNSKFSQLVLEADQESVKQDLKKSRLKGNDLLSCLPIERYIFEAIIKLIESGSWKINTVGARVWVLSTGVYINWRSAADIINVLLKDKVPAIPRDCEKLADILFERGYADYFEKKAEGVVQKLRYHPIIPDIPNAVVIQALKISDGALIFPRLMPPSIFDRYSEAATEKQKLTTDNSSDNAVININTNNADKTTDFAGNKTLEKNIKKDDQHIGRINISETSSKQEHEQHAQIHVNLPNCNLSDNDVCNCNNCIIENSKQINSADQDDLINSAVKKTTSGNSTTEPSIKIIGTGGEALKNIFLEFIDGKPITGFLTNSRSVIIDVNELFNADDKDEILKNLHKEKVVNAHEENYFRLNANWSKFILNKCEQTNSKILRVPLNFMSSVRLNKNVSSFAPRVIPINEQKNISVSSELAIDSFLPKEAVNIKDENRTNNNLELFSSIFPDITKYDISMQNISKDCNEVPKTSTYKHNTTNLKEDFTDHSITESFFLDLQEQFKKNNFSSLSILDNEKAISHEDFQNFVLNKYPSLDYLNLLASMGSNTILGADKFRYKMGQITCRG